MIYLKPIFSCQIEKCQTKQWDRELAIFNNQLIIKKVRCSQIQCNEPREIQKILQLASPQMRISWKYNNFTNSNDKKLSGFKIYENIESPKSTEYKADYKCLKKMKEILDGKTFYNEFYSKYKLLKIVKKRESSQIIQCRNTHTGEIKIAKISKYETSLSEINISIKLKQYPHNYILSNDEIYLEEDQIIFVMDYCEGGTLFNYFKQNNCSIPLSIVIKIAKKILKALIHLHGLNITHRDLKHDNIMFKYDNDLTSIKIIDFGFAREGNEDQILCGTPGYIAPEILNGEEYTELCDIYSLGSLFHSLLSGQSLFPLNLTQQQLLLRNKQNSFRISVKIHDFQAIDLLKRMLSHKSERPSAIECLNHHFFQTLNQIADNLKTVQNLVLKNPFQKAIKV